MRLDLDTSFAAIRQKLRDAGYHQEKGEKVNYSRRLQAGQAWPRFHLYIEESGSKLSLDLHLDQKEETRHYQAVHAHNGEYDGPLVTAELQRLAAVLRNN